MARFSTIELFKEAMKFSAGHFTVFSNTLRENLHGHNYHLYAAFTTCIGDEGLSFDYRRYKEKLYALCKEVDEVVLLPGLCKHLAICEKGAYYHIQFADEEMIFLKRDALILPIQNVTVEELSNWFLQQLLCEPDELAKNKVTAIQIKIFSGPGQSGSASWQKSQLTSAPAFNSFEVEHV